MTKGQKIKIVCDRLYDIYPDAVCALEWGHERGDESLDKILPDAWKLLVMSRLSAQCTDKRVNIVSKELFEKYKTPEELGNCELSELEEIIRPCGLFRTKAASIKASAQMLVHDYNGILPSDMDELLKFPGIGRKIANLLRGDIFGLPAIVADTHCIRICGRLGMYDESIKDANRVEKILVDLVPPERQSGFCHRIVEFGRDTCTARSPACSNCPMSDLCSHTNENKKN